MKILKLRFKNLNSLVGEWSIDFTRPEYQEDGIFAISGPTGAGKSTIMDAICLALYGCTPRLPNISKSSNEIMSRQTGECFAEVLFETEEGRFMAHWSQHRARGKATGDLQVPKHEIAEEDTQKILASQLKSTAAVIESKTGMDFKRFTQSMMLAQGGFAAFLQASPDDRAPILEQITGTEIYSDISMHVYERQKEEKIRLDQMQAEQAGITILSAEEEELIAHDLEEKGKELAALSESVEQLNTAVQWQRTIQSLKKEKEEIALEQAGLDQEKIDFEPEREILTNARKALPLEVNYTTLSLLRGQQKKDQEQLTSLLHNVPELEEELKNAGERNESARKIHENARKERDELQKLTTQVRLLDQDISQKSGSEAQLSVQISALNTEKNVEEKKKLTAIKSLNDLDIELQEIEKYLEANALEGTLVTEFTGINVSLQGLTRLRNAYSSVKDLLDALNQELHDNDEAMENIAVRLTGATKVLESNQEKVDAGQAKIDELLGGRAIEEVRQRKDEMLLYLAELRKIANYEEDRARLEDGKACPLCGSVHHPYASGNAPRASEAEKEFADLVHLIEEFDHANNTLSDLSALKKKAEDALAGIRHQNELALQKKDDISKNITKAESELDLALKNLLKASEEIMAQLSPFGIREIPGDEDGIRALKAALEERKKKWQEYSGRKSLIDPLKNRMKSDIELSDTVIGSKANDIKGKEAELDKLNDVLKTLREKRQELFGDRDVEEEERRYSDKLNSAQAAESNASEAFLTKRQQLESHRSRIQDLSGTINSREVELENSERVFLGSIQKQGFAGEEEYLSFKVPADQMKKLEEAEQGLNTRSTQLQTKKEENLKKLQQEEDKKLTEKEPVEVLELYESSRKEQDGMKQLIWGLRNKLESNRKEKVRVEKILERIEKQAQVFKRWAALNSLIGSADGKKFRNFAQGLTLEIMISYANIQLAKLSDRYLLTRDREEPLELKVMDNYQAGEIRSTKNLSGGESFIVSMALALGLSGMSSRNVRVDSLFLDEGFGSLDEDTLETALGTLAGLRQDGKMIGVISHVGAMKERINTRITVQPVREGRSILSGPGCSHDG